MPTLQEIVYPRRLKFTVGTDLSMSLCHAAAWVFAVGDVAGTDYYDSNQDAESQGLWRCMTVRTSRYTGTPGTLTHTSGVLYLEGLWHRFVPVAVDSVSYPIKALGIRCIEGVTGWHSRFNTIAAWARTNSQTVRLVGSGVLSCTETVDLTRVQWPNDLLRFQGGTNRSNAGAGNPPTFLPAQMVNKACTISVASPGVVTATAHGLSAGQAFYFSSSGKLPGAFKNFDDTTKVYIPYYVKNPTANTFEFAASVGGSSIAVAGTTGVGDHYVNVWPGPTPSNVTTTDVVGFDGKMRRLGIVVKTGGNGSNEHSLEQTVKVWGDGNGLWTTPPSTCNIYHADDDSANSNYRFYTSYGCVGMGVMGACEKHRIWVHGIWNRVHIMTMQGASCDSIAIDGHCNNCQAFYWECEGGNTSVYVTGNIEAREDPNIDAGNWGDYSPMVWIRNGKFTFFGAKFRGNQSTRGILVSGDANEAGNVQRFGADIVHLDCGTVEGNGNMLEVRGCRSLIGNFYSRAALDYTEAVLGSEHPGTAYDAPGPVVAIGRVVDAGGFHCEVVNCLASSGVQIGFNVDGVDYYPYAANLGEYAIDMAPNTQYNAAGAEQNSFPTTKIALDVQRMKGGSLNVRGLRGQVKFGQYVVADGSGNGNPMITLPTTARKYTITKHASAVVDFGLPTLSTTGLTIV